MAPDSLLHLPLSIFYGGSVDYGAPSPLVGNSQSHLEPGQRDKFRRTRSYRMTVRAERDCLDGDKKLNRGPGSHTSGMSLSHALR